MIQIEFYSEELGYFLQSHVLTGLLVVVVDFIHVEIFSLAPAQYFICPFLHASSERNKICERQELNQFLDRCVYRLKVALPAVLTLESLRD